MDTAQFEMREKVQNKIKQLEKAKNFNQDVEDDPETKPLLPNMIDYTNKKLTSKIITKFANIVARIFFNKLIKQKKLIIKEVVGLENYVDIKGGAILTCNHFNPYDNYAIYKAIQKQLGKKDLYKVIREGNYTSFGGIYGFFFKHCNTLPLSSRTDTMKLFMAAIKQLLDRGEKILIYPEQSMWWNYRKPRPLKSGGFKLAAKNNKPIIPCFITLSTSDIIGEDGYYIEEYTVHFLPAIYPKKELSVLENTEFMKEQNFILWKDLYEKTYNKVLSYDED